jgi:hypothetical protein
MRLLEFIVLNAMLFLKHLWYFINSSSLLSSLLSAAIIGGFLIFIFRIPNFQLKAYAKLNEFKNGSLFFDVKNQKRFMAYDADDVFYKIYIPERLLIGNNLQIERSTFNGWESWDALYNFDDKDRLNIDGKIYIMINGISRLSLFPEQSVTLFRVNGNFRQRNGNYKIYFQFRTRYGFYPYFVREGWFYKRFVGEQSDILRGLLPSVILTIQ